MNGDDLKKEFGDYQTPRDFADKVCEYLYSYLKINPKLILEPTAGIGNFIKAAITKFPNFEKALGIEINNDYCSVCSTDIKDKRVIIEQSNFFGYDLSEFVVPDDEILVIGNPPWATNSELNFNLPEKINFKKLSGTDAITGASNFDICEYIILQLIDAFKNSNTTIAMLCKTSVARNILLELNRNSINTEYIKMLNFNSSKVFGISAPACLFIIKMSTIIGDSNICEVSDIEQPNQVISIIKCQNGVLSTAIEGIKDLEGICQYEWRQGVKHDCSSIMELEVISDGIYKNKRKEEVVLEETLVFPLMKSSSFKKPIICDGFKKYVIVTQKKAREDTSYIEKAAPRTWQYLSNNKELFDRRKSSIYKGAPAFSMFGVGDYSYSQFKVGVSGFYKKPLFTLLYNADNVKHPIMLDDTTYFLSFDSYNDAYACMLLLNSTAVQEFLFSISFQDAKRPYTKKVLQRLDLRKCIHSVSICELQETERKLKLDPYISEKIYASFKQLVN